LEDVVQVFGDQERRHGHSAADDALAYGPWAGTYIVQVEHGHSGLGDVRRPDAQVACVPLDLVTDVSLQAAYVLVRWRVSRQELAGEGGLRRLIGR
jgi:hypothetical protein